MKRNGFTLIEVLAVIILIGIISVIIYPKVANTINNSTENTNLLSIEGLIDSLNGYVLDKKATLTPFNGCSFDFDKNISSCEKFTYNGILPEGGNISVDSDGFVNGYVVIDDQRYNINNNEIVIGEIVDDEPVEEEFTIANVDYLFDYNDYNSGDSTWKNKINDQKNINLIGATKSSSGIDLYGTSSSYGYININASVNQTRYALLKCNAKSSGAYDHCFSSFSANSTGYALSILSSSGYIRLDTYNGSINSQLDDYDFHLFAIVVEGSRAKLYVDGNNVGEVNVSNSNYGNKITLGYTDQFGYNSSNRLTSFKFIAISSNTAHSDAEVIENSNKIMEEYGLK